MNKLELRNALLAMSLTTLPSSADAKPVAPTTPEQKTTASQNNNIARSVNINEVSPQGKTTTRHVYNWQEIAAKYQGYLDPSDFSKTSKLSKEQEFEYAVMLKAITRHEANNISAIEDKYYHDALQGKLTDAQCQDKIETAKNTTNQKTFTQIIAEERAKLEKDSSARNAALNDFKNFKAQDDFKKGISLTDKVDAQIEKNSQNSKTLSATLFTQKLNERT